MIMQEQFIKSPIIPDQKPPTRSHLILFITFPLKLPQTPVQHGLQMILPTIFQYDTVKTSLIYFKPTKNYLDQPFKRYF